MEAGMTVLWGVTIKFSTPCPFFTPPIPESSDIETLPSKAPPPRMTRVTRQLTMDVGPGESGDEGGVASSQGEDADSEMSPLRTR